MGLVEEVGNAGDGQGLAGWSVPQWLGHRLGRDIGLFECPSWPTRRQTSIRARSVIDARGRIDGDASDQVTTGQRGSSDRRCTPRPPDGAEQSGCLAAEPRWRSRSGSPRAP